MEGGNGVKRLIGVGLGWELGKAQDAPFLQRGLDMGFQPAQTNPLLGWQDWGSWSPRCCQTEEGSPASCLLHSRMAAVRSRARQGPGLSRKARILGGLGGAGAGAAQGQGRWR